MLVTERTVFCFFCFFVYGCWCFFSFGLFLRISEMRLDSCRRCAQYAFQIASNDGLAKGNYTLIKYPIIYYIIKRVCNIPMIFVYGANEMCSTRTRKSDSRCWFVEVDMALMSCTIFHDLNWRHVAYIKITLCTFIWFTVTA